MHVDLFRSTDEQIRVVIPSSLWPHKHLVATLLLHGTHQGNTPLHGASPWLGGKESACQCRFRSCMGKSPWRRKRQTTTVFLLEKSHGQRSLVGYTVHGVVRVGHDLATKQQQAPYILGCWGPECRAQALCLLSYEQQQWMVCLFKPTEDIQFSSVHLLRHVRLFATPWTAPRQASLSITNSWSLLKLMSIELVMPSNHLILCLPLFFPPSIFPNMRIFPNESFLCIRWPKYWSFSFSINPSNEYSGLISFRMDWLDLLAVQGTLKNLLQHHSSKASILLCSAFSIVQLSHLYMTTGKTIALTGWTLGLS